MNSTKKYKKVQESLLVQSDPSESNPLLGVIGGSASALQAPPRGGGDRGEALLYHSRNNSDKRSENYQKKESKKLTSKEYLQTKSYKQNIAHWFKKYGPERIGFLTLTFEPNLQDMKESQRMWNNLWTMIRREGKFSLLMRVAEPQKRGAIHYHCIVLMPENRAGLGWQKNYNIKGKIDWEIYDQMGEQKTRYGKRKYGRMLGKTAKPYLRHLWDWLNKKCESTGFGRPELMPVKKPEHAGNYVGKYLESPRENSLKKDGKNKNMRLLVYGKDAPKVANAQACHAWGKAHILRSKKKQFAEDRGIKDEDEMKEIYGPQWNYHLREQILNDEYMATYRANEFQELYDPDKPNKMVLPWKGTIVSGAFSHPTIEAITEEYLSDDILGKRNLRDHEKHHKNWVRAEKQKEFYERVYNPEKDELLQFHNRISS